MDPLYPLTVTSGISSVVCNGMDGMIVGSSAAGSIVRYR